MFIFKDFSCITSYKLLF